MSPHIISIPFCKPSPSPSPSSSLSRNHNRIDSKLQVVTVPHDPQCCDTLSTSLPDGQTGGGYDGSSGSCVGIGVRPCACLMQKDKVVCDRYDMLLLVLHLHLHLEITSSTEEDKVGSLSQSWGEVS